MDPSAAAGVPQAAAVGPARSGEPLGEQLYVPANIKNNYDVMNFNKIFISLLAGCFAGITGITGYKGFLVYLVAHVLMAGLLMLKAGFQAERFFPSSSTLTLGGVLSQTELLTFILFWTLSNNICYLF
ncbi:hypothetical protein ABPG77_009198 [Micractinium sp. CCAP 211/92]